MSTLRDLWYVKDAPFPEDLRKRYSRVEPAGPGWLALGFGGLPNEAMGERRDQADELASAPLSVRLGEAFYLWADTHSDELYYEHTRDGRLLRKLVWTYDGATWSWTCVAGEAEPWEAVLFDDHALQRDLGPAEREDVPRIEAIYRAKRLEAGARWPSGSAWCAEVAERHFGIVYPKPG